MIHSFNHAAMATHIQARIAHEDRAYAAQAAQAAFNLVDLIESRLSRFKTQSDIACAAHLQPGDTMRLSETAFACLQIAQQMEEATSRAFCATPAALKTQPQLPQWELIANEQAIHCVSGRLEFDLGAIGKGFALDRMGELLREWECLSFLIIAGGSSILAGDAPPESDGWSCGLGDDNSARRFLLTHASLSGSGLAVKGAHIFDPRTGQPAKRTSRAWVIADSAAESDALSTACMVLDHAEIEGVFSRNDSWLAFLDAEAAAKPIGRRPLPISA